MLAYAIIINKVIIITMAESVACII